MIAKQPTFAKQSGVAVITAVLVLAIAATAAATIAANHQLDMRRTENSINSSQAWSYAKGAEQFAMSALARDLKDSDHDSIDEPWTTFMSFPLEGGGIEGYLQDAQGKLNLNNLVEEDDKLNPTAKQRVSRLLDLLEINPSLVEAIIDWIDRNPNPTIPDGAERDRYQSLEYAYYPADQPMADISELRLVHGVDQETYNKLLDHVTALPTGTKLNVNTASAEVMASLFVSLAPDDALALAKDLVDERDGPDKRGGEPYKGFADLQRHPLLLQKNITLDTKFLDVRSNYFDLNTKAIIGKSHVKLTSTIHRLSKNNLQVVKRSQKI